MKRCAGSLLIFAAGLGAGCSKVVVDLAGYPCDSGRCIEGYDCHPDREICVASMKRGCDDDGVCWTDVTTGNECSPEGAYLPCGSGGGCWIGCRDCENGHWSQCRSAGCELGTVGSCTYCGHDCATEILNAEPTCDISGPANFCDYTGDCFAPHADADRDRANGCECEVQPAGERCDGTDGDCDGQVDDLNATEVNDDCDARYPGARVATWSCQRGCEVVDCEPGYENLDDDPTNGCEYGCVETNGGDESCDGLDNDCNGEVDETGAAGALCGDGTRCPLTETCDDGFTDACGSCNALCLGSGTGSLCGDGELCEETETCDDGFTDACGSCNADCTGTGAGAVCGDGVICPQIEICDDGFGESCSVCYRYRRRITIWASAVPANQSDFPVMIRLPDDTDLKTKAQGNGEDLRFTAGDGVTLLSHEIERYAASTGDLVAWVKTDLSMSSDTILYLYYGHPTIGNQEDVTGVWTNGFNGVWHLAEDPSITTDGRCGGGTQHICDSTSYGNHAVAVGSIPAGARVAGQVGQGLFVDGNAQWIQVADSASLDITGDRITLSGWLRSTVDQDDDTGMIVKSLGGNYNYQLGVQGTDVPNFRVMASGTTYLDGGTTLGQTGWYFIYGIYNGTTAKIYVDDYEDGTENRTGNIQSTTEPVLFGRRSLGDPRYLEGILDELRIAAIDRPVSWMRTEFANQSDPASFYSVGLEESSW